MKKNVKRSSDKFALDEFITVFFAAKIGQKKKRMSEDLRADASKYRPEVYKSEKSTILKKIHKVALGKLLT